MTTDSSSRADDGQNTASTVIDAASVDRLHKNAIGLPSVLYFSLSGAAFLAAVMANIPFIAAQAGASVPVVFLCAGLGLLAFGAAIVYFSRKMASAGGFYTWVASGLGKGAAFQTGWLLIFGYGLFAASLFALLGSLINTAMGTYFHLTLFGGWVIYALIATVLVFGLALLDIRWAARFVFVFMLVELATLVVLNVAIDFKSMPDVLHTFTLAGASAPATAPGGVLGIGISMVLAVWMFVGFDTAAVYGEEAKNPRRAVPVAIVVALIALLLVYTWSAYSAVIGYGWQHAADKLGKGGYQSYYALGTSYIGGWFAGVMTVLNITSNLACVFAFILGCCRYLYAMGRERILDSRLGKTHPRWKSPHIAILTQGLVTLLLILFFAFVMQKSNADGSTSYGFGLPGGGYTSTDGSISYLWLVTEGTMAILIVYILVNIAAIAHALRAEKQRVRVFTHVLLPVFSSLIFAIPLFSFVLPAIPGAIGNYFTSLGFAATPFPLNVLPLLLGVWIIGGWFYTRRLVRTNPGAYSAIGRVEAQGE